MMKLGKLSIVAMLVAVPAFSAAAQPDVAAFARAKRLWMQQDFPAAYEALKQYRDVDYGRSFEVDFMLGTCACRLPERIERGAAFLEWISYAYSDRLTDEGKRVVNDELTLCRANARSPRTPASLPSLRQMVTAGAVLSGKTYYGEMGQPSSTNLVRAVPLREDVIRARWIKRGNETGALQLVGQAMPGARAKTFSRFVVVSKSNHTQTELSEVNDLLERYLEFFVQNYGMRAPQHYVFVYLVPTIDQLREFASRHHGMNLNSGTIAYSFRDDLSVAAIIPARLYGSLFHELFHLTARSNFGDIPTWLDEGTAALYEVSQAADAGFRGTPNWRGDVLARFKDRIPSLRQLIEQNDPVLGDADDRVSGEETSELAQRRAIFAATARYFALYLQEKGTLFKTYKAVREYSASDGFTGTSAGVMQLVEQSTGRSIRTLNSDFRAWLSQQGPRLRDIPENEPLQNYVPPKLKR
jgi:hypothetical protein